MGFLSGHKHTFITDTINNVITSDEYILEIELGKIVKLIRADSEYTSTSNQIEAARAIRKHLKYGNTKQQLRALELLNLFVSQMVRLPALFNDTKLLERLQGIAMNTERDSRGRGYESKVIRRCISYIVVWTNFLNENASHLEAYDGLLELGSRVQSRIRKRTGREGSPQQRGSKTSSRRAQFMQDSADRSIHPGNGHYGVSNLALEEETPKIKMLISDSLAASTSLHNALLALKKGTSPVDDEEATLRFAEARELRRKVLRYLQLVTGGEFLGSLIRANEELVGALSKYDELASANLDDSSSSSEISFEDSGPVVNPFDDKNEI